MKRLGRLWVLYALCVALVLGALGWATRAVVRADRAEAQTAAESQRLQRGREALWRMESILALFTQGEQARPVHHYRTFTLQEGGRRMPSPLLLREDDLVLLRFQLEGNGDLTSPQVPSKGEGALAQRVRRDGTLAEEAPRRLEDLRRHLDRTTLREALQKAYVPLVEYADMVSLRGGSKRLKVWPFPTALRWGPAISSG